MELFRRLGIFRAICYIQFLIARGALFVLPCVTFGWHMMASACAVNCHETLNNYDASFSRLKWLICGCFWPKS